MNVLQAFIKLIYRIRYPISLPEDVAGDLGIKVPSDHPIFTDVMSLLFDSTHTPAHLNRFMPRDQAEKIFRSACKRERFLNRSLFSYYIADGWLAFECIFDEKERLRRVFVQHKAFQVEPEEGIEINLATHEKYAKCIW